MTKYPYILENKCLHCDSDIIIKRNRDKNNKYCSRGCVGKHLRTTIKITSVCLNCGNIFNNRSGDKNIFCSRKCQIEHNKKNIIKHERICKNCGKTFYPKRVTYSRPNGIYCSSTCARVRKYNFDTNYFNVIDNDEKAYWLGFIFADGNVYKSTFTLKLNKKDEDHLLLFKNHIKSEYPIKQVFHNNCCETRMYSNKLINDLNFYGITPNKTFKITMPELRKDLCNDFIRGYFDGDGCMYVSNKYQSFSIYSASKLFHESLFIFFQKELNIRLNKSGSSLSKSKICDIIKIYNFLYDKTDIVYLNRKKEKFTDLFRKINTTN